MNSHQHPLVLCRTRIHSSRAWAALLPCHLFKPRTQETLDTVQALGAAAEPRAWSSRKPNRQGLGPWTLNPSPEMHPPCQLRGPACGSSRGPPAPSASGTSRFSGQLLGCGSPGGPACRRQFCAPWSLHTIGICVAESFLFTHRLLLDTRPADSGPWGWYPGGWHQKLGS